MKEMKSGKLIFVLVLIILLLVSFIAYMFLIKPSFENYVLQKQNEAIESVLGLMIYQIQQSGSTQISTPNETIILVPYNPSA